MKSKPGLRGLCLVFALATAGAIAEEARYSDEVARYLERINREGQGTNRFRVDYPGGQLAWEHDARASPRHFLAVSGRGDRLHSEQDIEAAVLRAKGIFSTMGVADHFLHQWGDDGHRYYKQLMWPFVEGALHQH